LLQFITLTVIPIYRNEIGTTRGRTDAQNLHREC